MLKYLILICTLFAFYTGNAKILKKHIPDNMVVLSFDDATLSQYTVVAPLLKKFGFGATFFVCEFPSTFKDSAIYMNWQQIKELDRMGFEVANHTRNHAAVGKLTREKFLEELEYIEDKCDSLQITKPTNFAYPGYNLSLGAIEILREKGYRFARAGGWRAYDPLTDHPLLVPSWATNASNKTQIMESFNEAKNGKIVVLTIHGVPDVEHPWVHTPPELFEEYLQYLSDHQFKVISINDLNQYIDTDEAMKTIVPDLNKKYRNESQK
jgi:peptidoglycan/xylan/chitin deacetylase (PgdA/CDA1 family)